MSSPLQASLFLVLLLAMVWGWSAVLVYYTPLNQFVLALGLTVIITSVVIPLLITFYIVIGIDKWIERVERRRITKGY